MSVEVSVVMSVYNAEEFLREAIESILNQTFKNFELVIVDDGSTDRSKEIINSYKDSRIRIITQPNQGLSRALNKGIECSQGKYIARMDADDVAMDNRLELQFEFLELNPEFVAVGSNAMIIGMNGDEFYMSDNPITWEQIKSHLPRSPFFHSSVMFRKNLFLSIGGYNESIRHYIEDSILWNQLALYGKLGNLKCTLIKYRLVPSSISNRSVKETCELNSIILNYVKKGYFEPYELLNLQSITRVKSSKWKKSNYYLRIGKIFIEKKFSRKKAFLNLVKSLYFSPLNLHAYFNIAILILPYFVIKKWKKYRINRMK